MFRMFLGCRSEQLKAYCAFLMRATYITFIGSHQVAIGFPVQIIVFTSWTIKFTIAVLTKEFRFFNVFKKIIVITLCLITGITFSLFTVVVFIALYRIALFTIQTEVILIKESRQGCNDIKVSIMHQ